ncbi:TPA: hypothetical protein ACT5CK_001756 [Flavobacterium psychrophilum]|uniref:hypothetical protein n=1 Tax=Flavobacterium psychrophilum TaxID=96345 RepID=UPI00073EEB7B|nr:hypothetical protein [Flavobacterium psychrophilum]EKT3965826.1 hypothetical protein [Flavobacterium psychrophilum]ELV7525521.1 hypothetical protein [Flavobacterium psychrophilum]SNB95898.1 conserved hypothetical protein [Flavobacterium psychrophilum]GAQ49001.1 hypothetical protein FPK15_contig00023-0032 [Flavobacterium psychrophilum]GAW90689.1 hypothetical protein FPS14_contig00088-0004 [Flavobacterium psychrophilum]
MKIEVTEKHINDFLFNLYFDLTDGIEMAAIKRAYRNFNKTLENFPHIEDEKSILRNNWIELIKIKN